MDPFAAAVISVLAVIGSWVVVWWAVGLLMFTYSKIYFHPSAPMSIRLWAAARAGFVMPWFLLTRGVWPSQIASIVAHARPSEEDEAHFKEWRKKNLVEDCSCPKCRKRRGEI